ncbi:MAG: MBL fold metallo-hydrolase [Candidatus Methanofastidiosia archaeon]|jgi:7,8-dihydropterin-6-yl-methyl-4-(beta-D-ribofuranosyl)aminobenzene 5'-phosphate synthase
MKKIAIISLVVVISAAVVVIVLLTYEKGTEPTPGLSLPEDEESAPEESTHQEKEQEQEKEPEEKDKAKEITKSQSKTFSITVVYDNNEYNEDLQSSWGFSCFIQGLEKTILFDTGGNGTILLNNMEKMGINPEDIDIIVLSHIHGDHTGGLSSVLQQNNDVTVYVLNSFPDSFKDNAKTLGATIIEVLDPVKICTHVYTTGEMGKNLLEQSLIIETETGSIVITGCAHPGIVSIVKKAQELSGDVLFVMGGFHLGRTPTSRIQGIVSQFKKLGVVYVAPCHCSGKTAQQLFEEAYGPSYISVGVGTIITLDDLVQE